MTPTVDGSVTSSDLPSMSSWEDLGPSSAGTAISLGASSLVDVSVEDAIHNLLSCEKTFPSVAVDGKDVIMVVGKSVAGKSTFINFIATDNSNLISEEIGETGCFRIKERADNGRIGHTGVSSTMFPSLISDGEGRALFVDVPGLGDMRGPHLEILQTTLIKQAITKAKRVKFVVVVEYSHIEMGRSIQEFLSFVESIVTLVSNVEKYSQGICLIVSKVPFKERRVDRDTRVKVEDTVFLQQVVEFLLVAKNHLSTVPMLESLRQSCLLFIDVLLTREEGADVPSKVGLFRCPDTSGTVNHIELLQQGKQFLERLLFSKTRFIETNPGDFGFPLSKGAYLALRRLVEELAEKILLQVESLANCMEARIICLLDSSFCPEEAIDCLRLHDGCIDSALEEILDPLRRIETPLSFCSYCADDPGVRESAKMILEHLVCVRFLQEAVTDDVLNPVIEEMKKHLLLRNSLVRDRLVFYEVLSSVRDWLASHSVQGRRADFLAVWRRGTAEQGSLNLDERQIKDFLRNQAENQNFSTQLLNLQFDRSMISAVNFLLDEALNYKLEIEYERSNSSLLVLGAFVSLQELFSHPNYTKRKRIQQITVLAKYTIFFDKNMDFSGQNFKLALLAPCWEVVGWSRQVLLRGAEGSALPDKSITTRCKDTISSLARAVGHSSPSLPAGRPGLPGKPGGCFFGLRESVTHGKLLIDVSGGRGGSGEAGTQGEAGLKGDSSVPGFIFGSKAFKTQSTDYGVYIAYNYHTKRFQGFPGNEGERGTDGGAAGLGGVPGCYVLYDMGASRPRSCSEIEVRAQQGPDGEGGRGGEGGQGGSHGKSVTASINMITFVPLWVSKDEVDSSGPRAANGPRGDDGVNAEERMDPEPMGDCSCYRIEELKIILKRFCNLVGNFGIRRSKVAQRVREGNSSACQPSFECGGSCHRCKNDMPRDPFDLSTDQVPDGSHVDECHEVTPFDFL